MQIILEADALPERGTFQIRETVTIRVTANEARRQVDHWLLHEVNSQMSGDQPALVVGEGSVWRVPVYWSVPQVGRVGLVGVVDVDILSGEMDSSPQRKDELLQRGQELAAAAPPFHMREVPIAFLATHLLPTHQPGRPLGNPRELLSR